VDCRKCSKPLPDGSVFCCWCGAKQQAEPRHYTRRPNGLGTAFKRGRTWTCAVVVGWRADHDGRLMRVQRTKGGFRTKAEALAACVTLKDQPLRGPSVTLQELFEAWLPAHEARAGASTIATYRSAYKHFAPLHSRAFADLRADDWQACLDACPRGKSTKQDMRTVAGLLYKYAYDLDIVDKNYAAHLFTGKEKKGTRPPFTLAELEQIRQAVGRMPYADYVYFACYTGFRPTEMLSLTPASWDPAHRALTGGGKTKAGTDRIVVVSPKVVPILNERLAAGGSWLFPRPDGRKMDEAYFRKSCFEPLMESLGISGRTPYSCRHTFANLLKAVPGSDTDKAEMIGHADASMTKYYQSADYASLMAIADAL